MSASTSGAAAAGIAPRGFPGWLPPMLVKELRQGVRTPGFIGAFLLFQVVMVLLVAAALIGVPSSRPADQAAAVAGIDSFFWILVGLLLLVFTPLRALVGLRAEIESRTLELLMLTRLTAWRIVVGKWASLMAQAIMVLVTLLPYGMIRYFGGSVDLASDARDCVLLVAACAVLTGLALWASVLSRVLVAVVILVGAANQLTGGLTLFGQKPIPLIPVAGIEGFVEQQPLMTALAGALVLVLALAAAVRQIASPAENYAPLMRGIALFAVLLVPLIGNFRSEAATRGHLEFALVLGLGIAAFELGSRGNPLAAHLAVVRRLGPVGRALGMLICPGWPAAAVFALMLAAPFLWLAGFTTGAGHVIAAAGPAPLAWLIVLGFGGLIFPAVVLSFFPAAARHYGRWYVALVVGLALAGVADLHPFTAVLPVTGFIHGLKGGSVTPLVLWMQAGLLLATVIIGAVRSIPYWVELDEAWKT